MSCETLTDISKRDLLQLRPANRDHRDNLHTPQLSQGHQSSQQFLKNQDISNRWDRARARPIALWASREMDYCNTDQADGAHYWQPRPGRRFTLLIPTLINGYWMSDPLQNKRKTYLFSRSINNIWDEDLSRFSRCWEIHFAPARTSQSPRGPPTRACGIERGLRLKSKNCTVDTWTYGMKILLVMRESDCDRVPVAEVRSPDNEGRQPIREVYIDGVLVETSPGWVDLSAHPAERRRGGDGGEGEALERGSSRGVGEELLTLRRYLLGDLETEEIEPHWGLLLLNFVSLLLLHLLHLVPCSVGHHPPLQPRYDTFLPLKQLHQSCAEIYSLTWVWAEIRCTETFPLSLCWA